jgi:hypothetical protein
MRHISGAIEMGGWMRFLEGGKSERIERCPVLRSRMFSAKEPEDIY